MSKIEKILVTLIILLFFSLTYGFMLQKEEIQMRNPDQLERTEIMIIGE